MAEDALDVPDPIGPNTPLLKHVMAADGADASCDGKGGIVLTDENGRARAVNDLGSEKAKVGRPPNRPFVLLKRLPAEGGYSIPVDPNAGIFVNEIIDLAEFGLIQSQWLNQIDVISEKRVNGEWMPMVPNYNPPDYPAGFPPSDSGIPGVWQRVLPLMDMMFNYDTGLPEGAVLDYGDLDGTTLDSRCDYAIGFQHQANRCRFVRFLLKRDPGCVYTPEQVAALADMRVHLNLLGPQNKVVLGTFNIPEAQGAPVCDVKFDTADYGGGSSADMLRVMVEFLRNGKIVHTSDGNAGTLPWPAYLDEVFDPPTLPLQSALGGYYPTSEGDDYKDIGVDGDHAIGERYSGGDTQLCGDVTVSDISACLSSQMTTARLRLWRAPSDGVTEYVPTRGAAPIPIPAGVQASDQVRVSILIASRNQMGLYPFGINANGENPDPWQLQQDLRDHGKALTDAGTHFATLDSKLPRTVDALPAADASLDGIVHRLHVAGQPDTLSLAAQKADGSWAWVLIGTAP